MLESGRWIWVLLLPGIFAPTAASAQIDPVKRQLIQVGFNAPLEGRSPVPGYAFYYYNQPAFIKSNLTLRLAVAPVYLDSELGISKALGPNTDVGIGIAGGGFADSYYELRQGKFLPSESFTGHGGRVSGSIYHLFNPTQQIPLHAVFRTEMHYSDYVPDTKTATNFTVLRDQASFNVRTGLRWGGKEPLMMPDVAMELSAWYEGQFRLHPDSYGFGGDRRVERASHLYWGRALLAYTLEESRQNFMVSVTSGASVKPDRFSAYRLGGMLPLSSEFPLSLPGYFYQEISARRFMVFNANYGIPLDKRKRWALTAVGSTAWVDYLPGFDQPGHWHSGVGGGISFRSNSGAWQIMLDYGYGFNAIRTHGRGAQSIGLLLQWNLVRTGSEYYFPGSDNILLRGLDRFLNSFN